MGKHMSKQQVAIPHNMNNEDTGIPESPLDRDRSETVESLEDSLDVESLISRRLSTPTSPSAGVDVDKLLYFLNAFEQSLLVSSVGVADSQSRKLGTNVYIFKLSFFDSNTNELKYFVHRTFENFTLLHSTLQARFPGKFLPPLSKTGVNVFKSGSENLALSLQFYLNYMLRNPFIVTDRVFQEFTRSQDMFTEKRLETILLEHSEGVEYFRAFIAVVQTPKDPKKVKHEIHLELDKLIAQYKSLKTELVGYISTLEAQNQKETSLAKTFENWSHVESTQLPQLLGSIFYEKNSMLENETNARTRLNIFTVVDDTKRAIQENDEQMQTKMKIFKTLVNGNLSFEIELLEQFIHSVHFVRKTVHEYKVANKRFKSCNENYNTVLNNLKAKEHKESLTAQNTHNELRKVSFSSEAFKDSPELIKAKDKREKANDDRILAVKKYNEVLRTVLVIEFNRLKFQRAVNISQIIKAFAQASALFNQKSLETFSGLFNKLPGNVNIKPLSDILLLDTITGTKSIEEETAVLIVKPDFPTFVEQTEITKRKTVDSELNNNNEQHKEESVDPNVKEVMEVVLNELKETTTEVPSVSLNSQREQQEKTDDVIKDTPDEVTKPVSDKTAGKVEEVHDKAVYMDEQGLAHEETKEQEVAKEEPKEEHPKRTWWFKRAILKV